VLACCFWLNRPAVYLLGWVDSVLGGPGLLRDGNGLGLG
jgi:hypothetical protein